MRKWYDPYASISLPALLEKLQTEKWIWLVKRLSGNDTGLTGGHQVGLYIPRWFAEDAFPQICTTRKYNPDIEIREILYCNQDKVSSRPSRAIYYNNKHFPERGLSKKYDEFRITRLGGSLLQNSESTGAIALLGFKKIGSYLYGIVWVTTSAEEEEIIQDWLGDEIIPGNCYGRDYFHSVFTSKADPDIAKLIKKDWLHHFPTGEDIVYTVEKNIPMASWTGSLDLLLLKRREMEFKLFEEIERQHVLPMIKKGFKRVDDFLSIALSIANRRKTRTGRSLELNLSSIFKGSSLHFESNKITENHKRPDFIFPSIKKYRDSSYSARKLAMLAAKTTCKDRWRQVLSEANRIKDKHLFTLQEGVSGNQLDEMAASRLKLVVPEPNLNKFPASTRSAILTLERFVQQIKSLQENS